MKLSGNKNTSALLLIVLVAALLFALYYYVVLPKKDQAASLESSKAALQTEIATLQEQQALMEAQASLPQESNITTLRKKLPASREIDQLLLNLEEIEYITQSRILSIGFNSYDTLVSESGIVPVPEEEVATEEAAEGQNDAVEEETMVDGESVEVETPVSQIAAETLPPELKLITFNLEIAASEYEDLLQFIEEIENLERIMHIDSISYTLPGEEEAFMEEAEALNASVQVTTFYYEGES
ncbi:type 4a pilus biogenesis protein PilO [Lysinibacillus yapensis]|nr:type 4a pilus biogenesis protein PilO [Lysinibacillus yapensis]